ncbi:MAG: Ig-like domain-containing protein, partial [Phototrophicaceae bacterium]
MLRKRLALLWMLCLMLAVLPIGAQETSAFTEPVVTAPILRVTETLPTNGALEIAANSPITVIFNRPVVPLTTLAAQADLPQPLTLTPSVEGRGEWLNTSIYIFRPTVALAGGTEYNAQVSALTSIDGIALEPFSWRFSTQPPQVLTVSPEPLTTNASLSVPIQITFNQPINQETFASGLSVTPAQGGAAVNGSFAWDDTNTSVTFTPTERLQLNTDYRVLVDGGLVKTSSGDVLLGQSTEWIFSTAPFPAIISTDPYNGEAAVEVYGSVALQFSSAMNPETLESRVEIAPEPARVYGYFSDYDNTYRLSFDFEPSTLYTVTTLPGMEDIYGNPINDSLRFTFTTRALDPDVTLQVPGAVGFYNANRPATELFISYRNVQSVDLALYQPSTASLVSALTTGDYEITGQYSPSAAELLRQWNVDATQVPQNIRRYDRVNLSTGASANPTCDGALPS